MRVYSLGRATGRIQRSGVRLIYGLALMAVVSGCEDGGSPPTLRQSIAVPAYFEPGPLWNRMAIGHPTVAMAVLNPSSGAGSGPVERLVMTVRETRAAGVQVLGYVHTSYGRRAASEVFAEVERYKEWYDVDGIFFDEVSATCADQPYYSAFHARVKAWGKGAKTVLNPGRQTMECFMSAADVVITFEGAYDSYMQDYRPPSWTVGYAPSRFWHLVYEVPSSERMKEVMQASKSRGVGWIYITPETMPNPWRTLPSVEYWSDEVRAAGQTMRT